MSERDCPDVTFYKLSKIRSSNRLKTHGLATQHVLFSKTEMTFTLSKTMLYSNISIAAEKRDKASRRP
jgi:hypothetical protein